MHHEQETGRRWILAAATIAILGGGACGEWQPPKPVPVATIPAYPDPIDQPKHQDEAPARSPFAMLSDRILDRWLAEDHQLGRGLGLHEHDGKVGDYSAAGLAARLARVEKDRAELGAVDKSKLSADEALDLALMLQRADMAIFEAKDLEVYKRSPLAYGELFGVIGYLDRNYAPIEERAERLLDHEEAALKQVPHIKKNLAATLSKPVLETSVKMYKGFAEYLRKDVPKLLKGVGSAAFQEKLARTNEALAAAAAELAEHFKKEAKKGDDSHVLGPDRYRKLLKVQEGLDIPLAELKKMGEENLAQNQKAYRDLLKKKVTLSPVKQADLFADATKLTEEARQFVIDKKIASVPSELRAVVKESPPFMRWNSAFLDAPGVFEKKAGEGFYYISLPDPSWSKKEQEDYIPPRGILISTTVHEVWPGHFLQGLWDKRAPTRAQKILSSYSFVEGWAHYSEQMMIEEGFAAQVPDARLGQLTDALLRNCRVLVSLGVHTEKMTMAQAEKRFHDDCHQDKATSREQAARAAFDPGYFAYTLGKMQILELRLEAKKKLGKGFSLQRFHDALLSHGAPPVALIKERVLREIE